MSLVPGRVALTAKLFLLALSVLPQVACKSNKPGNPSISAFATTDDAGKAVAEAAKSGDRDRLLAIFGPDAKDVIFSGDALQDRNIASSLSRSESTRLNSSHRR